MRSFLILPLLAFIIALPAKCAGTELLSPADRQIILVSAFTATGDTERLREAIDDGLDNGLAVNEIKEIMVQMYAYCGFPRSLNALNLLMNTVDGRKAAGKNDIQGAEASPVDTITDMSAHGEAVRTSLAGRPVTGRVYEFCPVIDEYLRSHLFGDIFARDNLSYRQREIATSAALAAMNLEPQLRSHLSICRNLGYTERELRIFADIISTAMGEENGATVSRVLDSIFSTSKQQ